MLSAWLAYGEMFGVTPALLAPIALDESASPSPETFPAPESSGVTAPPPLEYRPAAEAEYGGALEIVADALESSIFPSGAGGYDAVGPTAEPGAVEFIEVGPISVVLNGVSGLPAVGAPSYAAPGFSGPGGAGGPPYGAFRSAAGETGIEKLGL